MHLYRHMKCILKRLIRVYGISMPYIVTYKVTDVKLATG